MRNKVLTAILFFVLLSCSKNVHHLNSRQINIPESLPELLPLFEKDSAILLVPLNYSCNSCIQTIKNLGSALNKNSKIKNTIMVFLMRGEVDEYFLHNISFYKYNFYLINDELNNFLLFNNLSEISTGTCMLIIDKKVTWTGDPLGNKRQFKRLLKELKSIHNE